jgi:poly(hydroxyalkanoate) depolymerase family esterase
VAGVLRVVSVILCLAGAGLSAGAGQFESGQFPTLGGYLSYRLYVPSTARTIDTLVVALHGCTQDGEALAELTRLNEAADRDGFAVLYPEQSRLRNWDGCWNWFLPIDQVRGWGEPEMVAELVTSVAGRWRIDRSRTFLVGISAGGAMAATLAVCYPDRFSAVAIHSGLEFRAASTPLDAEQVTSSGGELTPEESGRQGAACSGLSPATVPLILFQGTADTRVYPVNAAQLLEQFAWTNSLWLGDLTGLIPLSAWSVQSGQVPGGYAYTVSDYGPRQITLLRQVVVQGLEHAWAGGPAGLPYSDPKGPDATAMLLSFFHAGH